MVKVFLVILSKVPFSLDDARGDLAYIKNFVSICFTGTRKKPVI